MITQKPGDLVMGAKTASEDDESVARVSGGALMIKRPFDQRLVPAISRTPIRDDRDNERGGGCRRDNGLNDCNRDGGSTHRSARVGVMSRVIIEKRPGDHT
jgi:hypothetical protein